MLGVAFFISVTWAIHGYSVVLCLILLTISFLLFYYGIKIILKDSINTILSLVLLVLTLSFINKYYQIYITLGSVIFLLLLVFKRRSLIKELLLSDYKKFILLQTKDLVPWIILFIILIFLGLKIDNKYLVFDILHPIYELSAGNSYGISILNAPDLSYSDKIIKFHFLSTRIPLYISNILNISVLSSVYFVTPYFLLLMLFLLINSLFFKFPYIRVPAFFYFFFPLFSDSLLSHDTLFNRLLQSTSYFLGYILIIISFYYLVKKNYFNLILTAIVLLLVKASFFLTLVGGIILLLGREKQYKELFKLVLPLLFVFIILYKLFFSGAHAHNLWILFPAVLYEKITLSYSGTFFGLLSGWFGIITYAILIFSTLNIYFKNKNDYLLLGLASISISGIVGTFLLTEVTEGNARQFMIAAYFSTSIVFWYWFNNILLINKGVFLRKIFKFVCFFVVLISSLSALKPIAINMGSYLITSNETLLTFSQKVKFDNRSIRNLSHNFIDHDLVDAYTWLRVKTVHTDIILFGKQYEYYGFDEKWWPDTGFVRSALSGSQMYCENYKYKGIGMEKDYPLRFANILFFYKQFVFPSASSENSLNYFFSDGFGLEQGIPFSKNSTRKEAKILYYLSLGKNWSWLNRPKQINYEMRGYFDRYKHLKYSEEWAINFLKLSRINYIILENGDKPSSFLLKNTKKVYNNKSITILKIKETM